jgi:hypothetical protein
MRRRHLQRRGGASRDPEVSILVDKYGCKHNREMVKQAVATVSSNFPREVAEAIILNKHADCGQVY